MIAALALVGRFLLGFCFAVAGGAKRARMVARLGAPTCRIGQQRFEQPHQRPPLLHGAAKFVHRVLARAFGIAYGLVRAGEDSGGDRTQRRCDWRLRPQSRLATHVHFRETVHEGPITSFALFMTL